MHEATSLARLLLADMGPWGRGRGASVTNAIEALAPAAHRYLIAGFGIALQDTLVVERDSGGNFDLVCARSDGQGYRHAPLFGRDRRITPRTCEAFLSWAGPPGAEMLAKVQAVADGQWAGVEG